MSHAKRGEEPRLVELAAVPKFYAEGIGKIERLSDGNCCILWYCPRETLESSKTVEHEVVGATLLNVGRLSDVITALQGLCAASIANSESILALVN